MPKKSARRKRTIDHQLLIFEIKSWEPSYSFSVNRSVEYDSDYSEFAQLHLETVCVYPDRICRTHRKCNGFEPQGTVQAAEPSSRC